MNIIIVGCSQIGETLASELVMEDNNISMIDLSADKINNITSRYDIMGVVGNGATHKTQLDAGIDTADLFIAVTDSDELNLLCCMIAKKNGNCRVIARVINPEYNIESSYLKDELGLEMIINPEFESAKEIARILRFPSAMRIEPFARGKVELVTFKLPESSPLVGMVLKNVSETFKVNVLICTVERGDDAFIPNGNFVFKEKDIISVVATPNDTYTFFKKIHYNAEAIKNVMIIGADDLTHYLCGILTEKGMNVKVIDKHFNSCDRLSDVFPSVTVINGDPSDQEFLLEQGIENYEAFLSLTKRDEENIIVSLFAKNLEKKKKIISMVSRTDYADIVKHLDIDTVIFPKRITADMILRYVRATKNTLGSNVETMYNIIKGQVEVSEFKVGENSPITIAPLMNLHFKNDVLVAAILRENRVIIPRGADRILPGDSVIIVSKKLVLEDISDAILDRI